MTFGDKLKKARNEANMKQSDLAEILGTTNRTISNWEKGVSRPDLDMLSYICGALHVSVSYFLQPMVPDGEVNIVEYRIIEKYRKLDQHGKELVDTILDKEYDRCTSKVTSLPVKEPLVNAAHERTDIEVTDEMRKHDDYIMNDPNEWK